MQFDITYLTISSVDLCISKFNIGSRKVYIHVDDILINVPTICTYNTYVQCTYNIMYIHKNCIPENCILLIFKTEIDVSVLTFILHTVITGYPPVSSIHSRTVTMTLCSYVLTQ